MEIVSALKLIGNLTYKPGWKITATDHSKRFEGTVLVHIDYPAQATERVFAPDYEKDIVTYAEFPVIVIECDQTQLLRKILNVILEIETHEAREYFRVAPTMWGPFNPHRVGGMKRWGDVAGDLKFGIG